MAATFSPTSSLATSVLFNYKVGTLFIAPVTLTPVDDFDDLDTNGMANTWKKLYNDDRDWASGAFNQTATGHPDYGWGTYDPGHTGLAARRIFVIRYTDGSAKKLTSGNVITTTVGMSASCKWQIYYSLEFTNFISSIFTM